jgi:DNA repair protein RecO (recombination protein O)
LFYANAENEFLERGLDKPIATLSDSVLAAMRYVINSKPERFLSFNLQEDEQNSFYNACEKFLLNQLERGFYSLDFYKSML